MAQDPYRYFRLEARDLLDQFAQGVLDLERRGATPPVVQRLLRVAHTLKGAARVVKQPEIADRAHAIEDALAPFRDVAGAVPPDIVETLLGHLDHAGARVRALTPGEPAPASVESAPAADEGLRTVRADLAEMDALLEGVSETHAVLSGLRGAGGLMIQARHLADLLLEQLAPRGSGQAPGQPLADTRRAYETTEELRRRLASLERQLTGSTEQMDRELTQLRESAEQLRLTSAGALFASLERTARDAAQVLAKQIVFDSKGGDIRLDAQVLTIVQRAFVQIIRNAVAHGIEPEAERRVLGKPPAGRVSVNVTRRGRRIVFECRDDGRGVNLDAVRGAAVRRGLPVSEVASLDAQSLIGLLLRGGISTSDAVTEVSGRGIGLDIVREAAEQLGGDVTVRTESGGGTSFELVVPFSLASMDVLVVEASETAVTIPLDAVRTAMRFTADQISSGPTGASVMYEKTAIPFVSIPRLLYGARPPRDRTWSAVVVAGAGGVAAFGIDRLLGTSRAVVRPLPDHTPASPIVAGASFDSEGTPRLVLDPDGLVAEALGQDGFELEAVPERPRVLVVDDSLTTRMLEQSILESAGFEVDVAVSGEEGLDYARAQNYALFLVDVEMPGIDGFTFIERIRADPSRHHIPAILVTSRNAPEDRQRGRDAGAQGYIVKSEFDQTHLLKLIRPLVA